MFPHGKTLAFAAIASLALAACDDDPTRPNTPFALTACPVGPLAVNAPITLTFTQPVAASAVSPGNVVVTDAFTGFEVPGSLSRTEAGTIQFVPSDPLPFGRDLRIRVQNLLAEQNNAQIAVTVCDVETAPPPITELFWEALTPVTGNPLVGASALGSDQGYVADFSGPIFRKDGPGQEFVVRFNNPYYVRSYDVAFVTMNRGYGAHFDNRVFQGVLTETVDGGINWDTLFATPFEEINRLYVRSRNNSADTTQIFAYLGGGTAVNGTLWKYNPRTKTMSATNLDYTSKVNDIAFPQTSGQISDTTRGVAVTFGIRFGDILVPGKVWRTTDGGATWPEVAAARATRRIVAWQGAAIRGNGEIWVVGGSGSVRQISPAGAVTEIPLSRFSGLEVRDTSDYETLIFNDIEFAPGSNDQKGWIVGAELIGFVNGRPQFRGFIFETRDGGTTWVRQGVQGASGYGGEFPRLNRISARSATDAWIVGDRGTVITYRGINPTTPPVP